MACTDYDIVDAASTTTLLSLPAEVLLLVISALDPGDVLTVRKVRVPDFSNTPLLIQGYACITCCLYAPEPCCTRHKADRFLLS